MDSTLRKNIDSLRRLTLQQLQQKHREMFQEHSGSSHRIHLMRKIAWRLQAQAQGDLSQRARERAAQLAQDADLRIQAPRAFWEALTSTKCQPVRDSRLPAVGTAVTRNYQGQEVRVWVRENGFEYNGRIYGSLSAIAHQVTGTRWNGFLFFGLRSETRAQERA